MLRIASLPVAELHLVYHAWFGTDFWKPTHILGIRLSSFQKWVGELRRPPKVTRRLVGKQEGKFVTFQANEYPSDLSKAIAYSMVDYCERAVPPGLDWSDFGSTDINGIHDFIENCGKFLVPLEEYSTELHSENEIGQDFVASAHIPRLSLQGI